MAALTSVHPGEAGPREFRLCVATRYSYVFTEAEGITHSGGWFNKPTARRSLFLHRDF